MGISVGLCAQLACIWEVTARKPGNVHRGCDFEDVTLIDFLASAAALGPVFDPAPGQRVGRIILEAVRATRQVVATNTNLGIILLLAPLAAVSESEALTTGVARVLHALDVEDARLAYEAIRLAAPGGMGRVSEQDVQEEPTETLRQVMTRAAERDLIARQYANGFREVLHDGVPALERGLQKAIGLENAIIACHLHLLAQHPDTLIARKRGREEAEAASRLARQVIENGWPEQEAGRKALAALDTWLRADGHARNPGTTADLVTACLFVALRQELITLPLKASGWSTAAV
ncbi:MAG TPA: triphosphoribosyl-dephospho-CoA synthase [Gemmataceae bacterium]|nr:triphosphoribosyl-dephospho-CoA synthase [Gemmataceae bacterium]